MDNIEDTFTPFVNSSSTEMPDFSSIFSNINQNIGQQERNTAAVTFQRGNGCFRYPGIKTNTRNQK